MAITTWQQHKKILMKNPEFRKEWNALQPEYALKRRLIELRMKKEITQKQLAQRAGTHQASIARFERGDYSPTLSFVSRLAMAMGMKLEVRVV